jgi:chromosome segregation ATPase
LSTTTIEDQLAEVCRRIGLLRALAHGRARIGASPRIRRHLDALDQEEAAVLAAARRAPDEVEMRIEQLKTRLAVAEHAASADLSEDWATFAAGVEDELRSWDTYLERLQASVASNAWKTRERAEAAISEVRTRRIAVYDQLAQARESVGDDWQAQRSRVTAARDELEQKADDLSATFT